MSSKGGPTLKKRFDQSTKKAAKQNQKLKTNFKPMLYLEGLFYKKIIPEYKIIHLRNC